MSQLYSKSGEAGLRVLYRRYKNDAKRQGRKFELSINQFKKLTSAPCHYCGESPNLVCKEHNTSKKNAEFGAYYYNGIDRIDNNKGYIRNNVVPCCKIHNQWKKAMTYSEFIKLIGKTHKHIKKHL